MEPRRRPIVRAIVQLTPSYEPAQKKLLKDDMESACRIELVRVRTPCQRDSMLELMCKSMRRGTCARAVEIYKAGVGNTAIIIGLMNYANVLAVSFCLFDDVL